MGNGSDESDQGLRVRLVRIAQLRKRAELFCASLPRVRHWIDQRDRVRGSFGQQRQKERVERVRACRSKAITKFSKAQKQLALEAAKKLEGLRQDRRFGDAEGLLMQLGLGVKGIRMALEDILWRLDGMIPGVPTGTGRVQHGKRRKKPHQPEMASVIQQIRQMREDGLSHKEICDRLADAPVPRNVGWRDLTWKKAYADPRYCDAVKTWISKQLRVR